MNFILDTAAPGEGSVLRITCPGDSSVLSKVFAEISPAFQEALARHSIEYLNLQQVNTPPDCPGCGDKGNAL